MKYLEDTYGFPFPTLGRNERPVEVTFNLLCASIFHAKSRTLPSEVLAQSAAALRASDRYGDCRPLSVVDASRFLGQFLRAQDEWLGAVSPTQAAAAVAACEDLAARGGESQFRVRRTARNCYVWFVHHGQPKMHLCGVDVARVLGWIRIRGDTATLERGWGTEGFFREKTRRRITDHPVGTRYLKEQWHGIAGGRGSARHSGIARQVAGVQAVP